MHFFNMFALILVAMPSFSLASPAAAKKDPRRFNLVTKTIPPGQKYDGLYVLPYHVQASGGYAGLSKHPSGATAFLNNSKLHFDLGKGSIKDNYLMDFYLVDDNADIGWITILAGNTGRLTDFIIDKDGFLINKEYAVQGKFTWKGCEFWHNTPELFWHNPFAVYGEYNITPKSCNELRLKVEYV